MKKLWLILGVLVVVALLAAIYVFGVRNSFVSQEAKIVALQKKCQNTLSTMTNSLRSQGLVQAEYKDMLLKALDKVTSARKLSGALAVMNAIKEDNPTVSDDILKKIQNAIEGHYTKFESDQNTKVDAVRILRSQTDPAMFPRGAIAQFFGFPRITLDDYDQIIMSEEASKAFDTGKLAPVNPFGEESKAEKE